MVPAVRAPLERRQEVQRLTGIGARRDHPHQGARRVVGELALVELPPQELFLAARDGGLDVCVRADGVDSELSQLHVEMVKQAQAHRGELLRALLGASADLLRSS